MSLAQLRASLAAWRVREAIRKTLHTRAQRDLEKARVADTHPRQALVDRRDLRANQLEEARTMIERREAQIESLRQPTRREKIAAVAELCAANYRKQPSAYHYLAGGTPNTIIDRPTPRGWRSDCSQFAVNVYRMAGLPCPGTGTFIASNTVSMVREGSLTTRPKPGDLGFYGSRWYPHHVEVYIGNGRYIGHGTAAIDSRTPGRPSFHLNYLSD